MRQGIFFCNFLKNNFIFYALIYILKAKKGIYTSRKIILKGMDNQFYPAFGSLYYGFVDNEACLFVGFAFNKLAQTFTGIYFFYSNIRIFTCTFISFVRKILKKIVYLSFKFIFLIFSRDHQVLESIRIPCQARHRQLSPKDLPCKSP